MILVTESQVKYVILILILGLTIFSAIFILTGPTSLDSRKCTDDSDCVVFGETGDCNCGCYNKDNLPSSTGGECFLSAPIDCKCVNGKCEGIFEGEMSFSEARQIAEQSECVEEGNLKEGGRFSGTNNWEIDLEPFIEKEGCNPVCVVSPVERTAEINWRCTGCAKEGEQFSQLYDEYPENCCEGLTEWDSGMDTRISIADKCYETGLPAGYPVGTCINCGNGICEDIENPCNCPEDCEGKNKSDFLNIEEFCQSEDWNQTFSRACEETKDFPICKLCKRYLTYYPTHEYGGNETKVLLLNSDLRYGVYDQDIHQLMGCYHPVAKGDPCVIINVTIRNDYTEKWPAGYQISLTADLYNTEGEKVGTIMNQGQLFCGFVEVWKVECGETRTFDIYVDYDKQDVDHYDLYIYNIQKYPTP